MGWKWNGAILAGGANNSRTAEAVFNDFKGRRNGLITALTNDFESFYSQCGPEKEKVCLYGYPDGQWVVKSPGDMLPGDKLPEDLPEPALGINLARDGMLKKDWLCLVAAYSDAWLLSLALYFGARYGFDKSDRNRLFHMINDLPTIYETVCKADKEQVKDNSSGETNRDDENDEDDEEEEHSEPEKREHSKDMGWNGANLAGGACNSRTVKEVFDDFKGRRAALITALTDDRESLLLQCDPEQEDLCLYGYPDGNWEVISPAEKVLQELPEPTLVINFAIDEMEKKDWLCRVAAYSDAWLLSLAFHLGAINGFDKSDRNCLFDMINDLPTIYETVFYAVIDTDKEQAKDNSSGKKRNFECLLIGEDEDEEEDDDNDDDDDDDDDDVHRGEIHDMSSLWKRRR